MGEGEGWAWNTMQSPPKGKAESLLQGFEYYSSCTYLYSAEIPKCHQWKSIVQNKKWGLKHRTPTIFTSCLVTLNCLFSHFLQFQYNWLWIDIIAKDSCFEWEVETNFTVLFNYKSIPISKNQQTIKEKILHIIKTSNLLAPFLFLHSFIISTWKT